jgi:T5SS/PEP-CTERM-associated repeat protein
VTVGTNGPFTLLVLSNNVLLTNSGNGTIGLNATAKSNEVRVLSPSARWFVGNLLMVGSNGSLNRLVVSNGATVRDNNGYLGLNASASNNIAVVTGPGSLWHNTNGFSLGFNGPGNQIVVSNGGCAAEQRGFPRCEFHQQRQQGGGDGSGLALDQCGHASGRLQWRGLPVGGQQRRRCAERSRCDGFRFLQ